MGTFDINEVEELSHDLRALSGLLYALSASSSGGICIGSEELDLLARIAADSDKRLNNLFYRKRLITRYLQSGEGKPKPLFCVLGELLRNKILHSRSQHFHTPKCVAKVTPTKAVAKVIDKSYGICYNGRVANVTNIKSDTQGG